MLQPKPMQQPDDPRAELERLRKLKRLKELEAKAGGQSPAPAPQAAAPQAGGGFDMVPSSPQAQRDRIAPPAPKPMEAAPGASYSWTPPQGFAEGKAFLDRTQQTAKPSPTVDPSSANSEALAKAVGEMGIGAGAMGIAPTQAVDPEGRVISQGDLNSYGAAGEDIGKFVMTSPQHAINAGVGAAESIVNLFPDAINAIVQKATSGPGMGKTITEAVPRASFPRVPIAEDMQSVTGSLAEGLAQFLLTRKLVGSAAPGGGTAAQLGKDALAVGLGFDGSTGRMADMIDPAMIPEGPLRDYAAWLRTQPEDSPFVGRFKNLLEDLTLSGPAVAPQAGVRGVQAITDIFQPKPPSAAVRAATGAPAPRPAVAQPSTPVPASPVPQGAGRAGQAPPASAGQQAGGPPPVLQASPTVVTPPGQGAASLASSDAKIIRRLLVAGGVARNDVDNLLADMVHSFNLSNDPRSRLAFFAEEYLPQKLPKEVADDVVQKLRGFGRERYGANSPRDPSRAIMRSNIGELRGSQRGHLTSEFEGLLGKETLMNKQGKITRDKQGVAEAVYREEIGRQQRVIDAGTATPEQITARDDLLKLMSRDDFFKEVPPEIRLKAADEGKDLWEYVHSNPLEAAHWMQSELGVLARKGNTIAQSMRMPLVRRLEDAVPGYRGARLEYGDLAGQQAAIEFGDDLYRVAGSKLSTDEKALEFKKLSPAQKTVAKKSIRDRLLNEFRKAKTGDEQAAVITAMQKEGVLDALESILGADGKKVADAIRGMVKENERLRAVDLLSGSNTADNLAQQTAAREAVRSPVNKAIGAIGDEGSYLHTGFADVVSMALGIPPVWTVGKAGSGLVGKLGAPSKKKLASATRTLYGAPPRNALNVQPPAQPKPRGPAKPKKAKAPVTQDDLDALLRQYDKTPTPAIRNRIIAARNELANGPPKPPAKKGAKPPQSNSPAFVGGAALGATTGAMLDQEDPVRGAVIGFGIGGVGGGVLGNRLAKGGGKKAGPPAPVKASQPSPVKPAVAPKGEAKAVEAVRPPPPPRDGAIRAYHGSPNDFDRFVLSRDTVGTGEGAQSYGHGLYFGGNPEVGRAYRSKLSGVDTYIDGQEFNRSNPYHLATYEVRSRPWGNVDDAIGALRYQRKGANGAQKKTINEAIRILRSGEPIGKRSTPPRGYLYEVDIAADSGQLVDLDAPIANQSETVRKGFAALEKQFGLVPRADEGPIDYFARIEAANGRRAQAQISETLKGAGVPGSMYLDQGSRASGSGTRNYVIFDDALISVRNKDAPAPRKPDKMGMGGKSSLPMDEASRMQRAREQGFDVDTPLYHGTGESFDEFRPSQGGELGPGVYFSKSEHDAQSWIRQDRKTPRMVKAYARGKMVRESDLPEPDYAALGYDNDALHQQLVRRNQALKEQGYSGIIADRFDPSGNTVMVFDPANIRRTDAAFDPSQEGSSKLLAGMGGLGPELAVGGGSAAAVAARGPRDINGDGVIDDDERRMHQAEIGGSFIAGMAGTKVARGVGNKLRGSRAKGPPAKPAASSKPPPASMGVGGPDGVFEHLDALKARLAREQGRFGQAKTPKEREFRQVQIAQAEKEIAHEIEYLRKRGITPPDDLSVDELAAELSDFPSATTLQPYRTHEMGPASWVIREKGTGKVVMETFSEEVVSKLNTQRYEAIPAAEHLQSISRKPPPSQMGFGGPPKGRGNKLRSPAELGAAAVGGTAMGITLDENGNATFDPERALLGAAGGAGLAAVGRRVVPAVTRELRYKGAPRLSRREVGAINRLRDNLTPKELDRLSVNAGKDSPRSAIIAGEVPPGMARFAAQLASGKVEMSPMEALRRGVSVDPPKGKTENILTPFEHDVISVDVAPSTIANDGITELKGMIRTSQDNYTADIKIGEREVKKLQRALADAQTNMDNARTAQRAEGQRVNVRAERKLVEQAQKALDNANAKVASDRQLYDWASDQMYRLQNALGSNSAKTGAYFSLAERERLAAMLFDAAQAKALEAAMTGKYRTRLTPFDYMMLSATAAGMTGLMALELYRSGERATPREQIQQGQLP